MTNVAHALLIVEDDDATRQLLELLLAAEEWSVSSAASGEEALTKLKGQPAPACILCDLHLPGISGSALAIALRAALPSHNDTVFVAMSASSDKAEGFDLLIEKPFQPRQVTEAWQRFQRPSHPDVRSTNTKVLGKTHDLPILDDVVFDELMERIGPGPLSDLYRMAVNDTGVRVNSLHGCAAETELHEQAHALKGSCNMIGARRMGKLAAEMERDTLSEALQNTLPALHGAWVELAVLLDRRFVGLAAEDV